MDSSSKELNVCILGGGHACHVLMALLPSLGINTRVLASFGDEAARINAGISTNGGIKCTFADHLTPSGDVFGTPIKVSNLASEVIPQSNVLIIPLPSFAYLDCLKSIADYINPGTFIFVTPGQGGFDYIARTVLQAKAKDVVLCTIQPMPFNCRTTEYGKTVSCQQYELEFTVCTSPEAENEAARQIVTKLFGINREGFKVDNGGHFINATLMPLNANIHPQHLYRLLKDQKTYTEIPLFYESMDTETGKIMDDTSIEVSAIAKAVTSATDIKTNVPSIYEYEYLSFPDPNCKTIDQLFCTSPGYKGFKAPFKANGRGEYEVDVNHRYFGEDIPYGLCVWKGIAELVNVDTPTIDKLIFWCQSMMGKEYLTTVDGKGKLNGRDVDETSAPQKYGITCIKNLVGLN